jgi:hypothetical protein
VEYDIVRAATHEQVYTATEDLSQVTTQRFVDLKDFAPGSYTLRLRVTETNGGRSTTASTSFTIL